MRWEKTKKSNVYLNLSLAAIHMGKLRVSLTASSYLIDRVAMRGPRADPNNKGKETRFLAAVIHLGNTRAPWRFRARVSWRLQEAIPTHRC
jgi:hypothetical protein